MRSVLIVAGAAALNHFGWLFYPLAGILVWTAVGLLLRSGVRGQDERHTRQASRLRRRLRRPEFSAAERAFMLADPRLYATTRARC